MSVTPYTFFKHYNILRNIRCLIILSYFNRSFNLGLINRLLGSVTHYSHYTHYSLLVPAFLRLDTVNVLILVIAYIYLLLLLFCVCVTAQITFLYLVCELLKLRSNLMNLLCEKVHQVWNDFSSRFAFVTTFLETISKNNDYFQSLARLFELKFKSIFEIISMFMSSRVLFFHTTVQFV